MDINGLKLKSALLYIASDCTTSDRRMFHYQQSHIYLVTHSVCYKKTKLDTAQNDQIYISRCIPEKH